MNITILGSTGSIGCNTLDVIARHPDRFRVVALTAHSQAERLLEQCLRYAPRYAVIQDAMTAEKLQQTLRQRHSQTEVLTGSSALEKVASLVEVDCVVAAIVGAVGLLPTLAAVRSGKRVLLANKESIILGGEFFVNEVKKAGALLLPVDSEHSAIFQCMPDKGKADKSVRRILLTASGGPFRQLSLTERAQVTPEQAATHPIWPMGRKISIDSATMMNKGLEVIEAHWLFGLPAEKIEVIIHPQSIVHSMVETVDGAVMAQLGYPDMRMPIAYALAWPDRIETGVKCLDLLETSRLDFEPVDFIRYPCLKLAYQAMAVGGTATAILNAANEVAVQGFCDRKLGFEDIAKLIECVLENVTHHEATSLEIILADDHRARESAKENMVTLC